MSVYFATKHYVLAFSEALRNEFADFGITVTTLCPGPTHSGFQSAADLSKGDRKMATSKDVAEFGYHAMEKGKGVVVHGLKNRIMAFLPRFFPRDLIMMAVRKMYEEK
jgi:hypothetical protein